MYDDQYVITNILSETEIIISGGKEDGFKQSDVFLILDDAKYTEIKNPKTGEVLDTIYMYKDVLKVKKIENFYTILETEVTEVYNPFTQVAISSYTDKPINKRLNVDISQIDNILSQQTDAKIHVGDTVIKK